MQSNAVLRNDGNYFRSLLSQQAQRTRMLWSAGHYVVYIMHLTVPYDVVVCAPQLTAETHFSSCASEESVHV